MLEYTNDIIKMLMFLQVWHSGLEWQQQPVVSRPRKCLTDKQHKINGCQVVVALVAVSCTNFEQVNVEYP
jgi:hypothetical protein